MLRWYTGDPTYDTLLAVALVYALGVFAASWFLPAPYGRFASKKFGLSLNPRVGWFLMELPSTLSFVFFFSRGPHARETVPMLFAAMWLVHYGNRGFFFPFSIRTAKGERGTFSLMVVAFGWFTTALHGYFHADFFARLGNRYTPAWLADPRFLVGFVVYYACFAGNLHSDAIVRNLRSPGDIERGEKVYRIPHGGLFRWVSSPSYLTELGAWAGFALCTWSVAGVFIFVVSLGNLVPRAAATHRWYRERFPEYPRERRALIPFVW